MTCACLSANMEVSLHTVYLYYIVSHNVLTLLAFFLSGYSKGRGRVTDLYYHVHTFTVKHRLQTHPPTIYPNDT